MNWLQKIAQKALGMRHSSPVSGMRSLLRRTRFDYRKEVGDLLDASVVTAPIQWVQRSLPEARLTVRRYDRNGSPVELADHLMLQLIQRPNAFYGDMSLWSGTVFSYLADGNSYWIKLRNGYGRPGELWWVPHWTIEPKGEDGTFITHYEYRPGGGEMVRYDPADIVHFRHGIDPRNPRKGISPVGGAIREIFMDLESSNFVASLLRNMGTPGMVIAPKAGGVVPAEDVEATKVWVRQAFGGDRRGEPLVMGAPTDVYPYGFNPQQMNMSEARDVAEERICALIGIPAAVVGFGAGLQSTKVGATMEELRKLAWLNGVLPIARVFADELDRSLLPDFGNTAGLRTHWDTSEVAALQDDLVKLATRLNTAIGGGWAQVYEGREAMGWEATDADRIYLRPAMAMEVPAGQTRRADPGKSRDRLEEKMDELVLPLASPRARTRGLAFVTALDRQQDGLTKAMGQRLDRFFVGLGEAGAAAALPVLRAADLSPPKEQKADERIVADILAALGIDSHSASLKGLFEGHYLDVAKTVSEAAALAGISGSLPDPVARAVVAAGGRRSGLLDLGKQSRQALFDALAVGRAEGEGAEALAARIAGRLQAGPWGSVETRARTIARTETKYAQNVSTVERAKAAGVTRFIVHDGRLGPGRSLPSHIARDGSIVSVAEAEQMAADEHPNGTLSFSPYFGED
ncbi:portal protein [Microcystis phage Mwe-Yong1]|nr:portal protein [Microcystis phage Mwe-Yong1]